MMMKPTNMVIDLTEDSDDDEAPQVSSVFTFLCHSIVGVPSERQFPQRLPSLHILGAPP